MPADWSHRMTIAAPLGLTDLANRIGRALDPDVGGDRSFAGVVCGNNPPPVTHVVCDVLLTTGFAAQCVAMLGRAELLHGACAADYATRWPALAAPSFEDCATFLAQSIITIEPRGRALDDVLAGWGMIRLIDATDTDP